jgi:hypothetical protein
MSNLHRLFISAMTSFPCDNSEFIVARFQSRKACLDHGIGVGVNPKTILPEGDFWGMGSLFKILAINVDSVFIIVQFYFFDVRLFSTLVVRVIRLVTCPA